MYVKKLTASVGLQVIVWGSGCWHIVRPRLWLFRWLSTKNCVEHVSDCPSSLWSVVQLRREEKQKENQEKYLFCRISIHDFTHLLSSPLLIQLFTRCVPNYKWIYELELFQWFVSPQSQSSGVPLWMTNTDCHTWWCGELWPLLQTQDVPAGWSSAVVSAVFLKYSFSAETREMWGNATVNFHHQQFFDAASVCLGPNTFRHVSCWKRSAALVQTLEPVPDAPHYKQVNHRAARRQAAGRYSTWLQVSVKDVSINFNDEMIPLR